jgi:hypothetical protein
MIRCTRGQSMHRDITTRVSNLRSLQVVNSHVSRYTKVQQAQKLTSEAASGTFQSGQKWPRMTADPVAYCTYQEDTALQQGHMQSKDKCRQLVVKSAAAPGENKNEVRSSRRASHCSQRSREVCAAPQCTTIDLCLLVVLVHCLLRLLHHASCWSN